MRSVWVFLVVRSVQGSDDFWEGSGTPRNGRRAKWKHGGIRIFSRISTMAPGIQLILPGDFQEGAWPVSGCQCANPWTKVKCSGVQSPVSDDESPVHSGQQRLYRAVQRPVQNGVHPSVVQRDQRHVKALKYLPFLHCVHRYRWTGHLL